MDNEKDILNENTESSENTSNQDSKIRSAYRLKYGSFAAAVTALFIAVVILLNVIFSVLADKYPLAVDMTANKSYTVNSENVEFLKSIKYPVKLMVLFTEEMYADGTALSQQKGITDASGGKYYKQTIELLKQYKKYNKNISLTFVDPYSEEISKIITDFADVANSSVDSGFDYADILVEAYVNGEDATPKRGVIKFEDCYELEQSEQSYDYYSGTNSQNLVGNNVENAVANGIFKTVNLEEISIALLTLNSSEAYVESFKNIANQNAINIKPVSVVEESELQKYNTMMICAPSQDYTESEIKTLSKWLENDGKKGRTLLFFASAASPELPNLYGFLEEWGIEVQSGYKYYSDNDLFFMDENTNIYLSSSYSEYTSQIDNLVNDGIYYNYISNNMVPLKAVYESETGGTRSVVPVMETADTSAYKKPDGDSSWKPQGKGKIESTMLMSKDADEGECSYVLASSSVDFLTNPDTVNKTDNGNFKFLISILNTTSRDATDKYVMETKVISDTSSVFTKSTTNFQAVLIGIIFIGVIPLALIAAAIFVFIKRKNH